MSERRTRLQGILDAYVGRGIIGVSLAVSGPGEEEIVLTSGLADKFAATPLGPEHTFRIASCTKTFVAAALLQLVQEGAVDLDEPITRWFPDVPRSAELPVRILLNHRSGLPDFETAMAMISDKVWTPREIVDFAFANGEQTEPWGKMAYSNTGYILAGMIIAAEGGRSLSAELRSRLFEPLGLNDTWVGTDEPFPAERQARGHMHHEPDATGQWDVSGAGDPIDGVWDATDWFPLPGAGAAGDMISTPHELVCWLNALFDGAVIDATRLHEMKDNLSAASFPGSNVTHYGHGILVSTYGDLAVKGHLGQIPGHTTVMGRERDHGGADPELFRRRLQFVLSRRNQRALRRCLRRRAGGLRWAAINRRRPIAHLKEVNDEHRHQPRQSELPGLGGSKRSPGALQPAPERADGGRTADLDAGAQIPLLAPLDAARLLARHHL